MSAGVFGNLREWLSFSIHHSALWQCYKCQPPNVLLLWVYGKGLVGKILPFCKAGWLWQPYRNGLPDHHSEKWLFHTWKQSNLSPLLSFLVHIRALKQKILLSILKWTSFFCGMTFTCAISITPDCKVIHFFQYNCLTLLHLRNASRLHRIANFTSMLQALTRTLCKMRPKDQLPRSCTPFFSFQLHYPFPSHPL